MLIVIAFAQNLSFRCVACGLKAKTLLETKLQGTWKAGLLVW